MATLHNLKPEEVIKAFEKAGWVNKGQRGSHVKLIKPWKGREYLPNQIKLMEVGLSQKSL